MAMIGLWSVPALLAEWPGYLGPGRNGISPETGLLHEWPGSGPEVIWRAAVGPGFSSVAVAGGRLFTQFADGGDEVVAAFDAATGKELVLGGNGDLSLIEATPEAFRKKASVRISRDRTWAAPALADGVLYVRTWNELIALRVAETAPTTVGR